MFHFYHQLNLHPNSQHFTGFWVPNLGQFSYRRVPQGITGAPASAQKAIDLLLRGARKYSTSLMDDTVIYSMSWKDHLKHVRDVLERLRAAGLKANKSKCEFASSEIKKFRVYCETRHDMPRPTKGGSSQRMQSSQKQVSAEILLGIYDVFPFIHFTVCGNSSTTNRHVTEE